MIKLHGIPVSNYYNMVKQTLLEKGIDFEEVADPASQDAAYKAKSPMGKMPFLETEHGCLSETSAILEYLEETHPSPALYPVDAFARAKVREIMRILELYIELAARRHYPSVFFKEPKSEAAVQEVRPVVENALAALGQLGVFKPYVCGSEFSYADIVAHNTFGYAGMVMKTIYGGWDIVAAVPGLGASLQATSARDAAKKVDADQQAALRAFMAEQS
jgi:glutathione S-transferase